MPIVLVADSPSGEIREEVTLAELLPHRFEL
jgi:hypothetical protein